MVGMKMRESSAGPREAPSLLDIDGLAQRLGVSERFVRRLVEERRIPFHKIGRFVRFDPSDVERWIARSRVEPKSPVSSVAHVVMPLTRWASGGTVNGRR